MFLIDLIFELVYHLVLRELEQFKLSTAHEKTRLHSIHHPIHFSTFYVTAFLAPHYDLTSNGLCYTNIQIIYHFHKYFEKAWIVWHSYAVFRLLEFEILCGSVLLDCFVQREISPFHGIKNIQSCLCIEHANAIPPATPPRIYNYFSFHLSNFSRNSHCHFNFGRFHEIFTCAFVCKCVPFSIEEIIQFRARGDNKLDFPLLYQFILIS